MSDWEATVDELAQAPVPSLYLSLSQYAHVMLCAAGMDHSYVYSPDGRQERIPESDFADLRNSLRAMLTADRPAYIQQLERAGKIRPAAPRPAARRRSLDWPGAVTLTYLGR